MICMPNETAVSTAKLDGAPTAQMVEMPAIAAFCTNSKLTLPLKSSILSSIGT